MQNYSYSSNIKPPSSLGVSDQGNLTALSNDIKALQGYVDVTISGDSRAQNISPLGNKYFLATGAKCTDTTGVEQDRYAFINNIPDGYTGIGKGLVPGILENLDQIDPMKLFTAFSEDTTCQQITLSTRNENNKTGTESRYVSQADIADYNPCWFPDRKNPITSAKCEGMQNYYPDDPVIKVYFWSLGAFAVYLMYMFFKPRAL
jgi:hypothetical protein